METGDKMILLPKAKRERIRKKKGQFVGKTPYRPTVFLCASFSRKNEMNELRKLLKKRNYKVVSRWVTRRGYGDAVELGDWERAMREAVEDKFDVLKAERFVMFTPQHNYVSKGGRDTEVGIALAAGKDIIIVGERRNVYHALPQVRVYPTLENMLDVEFPIMINKKWDKIKRKWRKVKRRQRAEQPKLPRRRVMARWNKDEQTTTVLSD